jgi:hypothetical protein
LTCVRFVWVKLASTASGGSRLIPLALRLFALSLADSLKSFGARTTFFCLKLEPFGGYALLLHTGGDALGAGVALFGRNRRALCFKP